MSEEKFTPGPWKAYRNTAFWEARCCDEGDIEPTPYSPCVAFVWPCGRIEKSTEEKAQANAQLIAAAPALYEALEAAEQILKRSPQVSTNDSGKFRPVSTFSALREVRSALALARGEKGGAE